MRIFVSLLFLVSVIICDAQEDKQVIRTIYNQVLTNGKSFFVIRN